MNTNTNTDTPSNSAVQRCDISTSRLSDLLADESNNPQPIYSRDKIARMQVRAAQRQSINQLCANECNAVWEETMNQYHIKPNSIYPNLQK